MDGEASLDIKQQSKVLTGLVNGDHICRENVRKSSKIAKLYFKSNNSKKRQISKTHP